MNDAYANETMKDLLDRLKRDLGPDWAGKLADEMLEEDRNALMEALQKKT